MNNILLTLITGLLLQFIPPINSTEVFSGENDPIAINISTGDHSEISFNPDPRKASMYSAVLPGMGQIYNRKYWKVPVIYAGFAGLGWYMNFTNEQFVRYRNALDFRIDGNPWTVDEFAGDPRYTGEVLTRYKDYYRRQRDFSIILTALFYALNVVDAAVDAHLFEFDVGEDLGLKVEPSLMGPDQQIGRRPGSQMGLGVRFSVNF